MYIKNMFAKDIDRDIKGVIKVGQKDDENIKEENGKITLSATMNAPEEYLIYFTNIFPKALEKIKEISEK